MSKGDLVFLQVLATMLREGRYGDPAWRYRQSELSDAMREIRLRAASRQEKNESVSSGTSTPPGCRPPGGAATPAQGA